MDQFPPYLGPDGARRMNRGIVLEDLDGKSVLIAGGAGGLGSAQARLFHSCGAKVMIADKDGKRCQEVAAELGERTGTFAFDVTDESGWVAVVAHTTRTFGGVDVLVNTFGISPTNDMASLSLDDYETVIKVNQTGVFLGMKSVVPAMRERGKGSIVNISSGAGISPRPKLFAYSASKAAVIIMTKAAAMELGRDNIRVNCACPGGFDTGLRAATAQAWKDSGVSVAARNAYQNLPIPRLGAPEEMANLIAFLASDASSYCTGAVFGADGGALAGRP
jgi:3alpha(or 20beta)-hydroxysteroid dehydrogenase